MIDNLKDSNPLLILAGIILIPIAVAAASLWVDTRIDERQRKSAEHMFQRQERLIIAQTMDAYFQGVGSILMNDAKTASTQDRIIVARTNALLGRLTQPSDKAMVVRFVSQMRPILTKRPERMLERSSTPFIDLANVDLRDTDLSYVNLFQADLRGANLDGTNLQWANLAGAELSDASLDGADLRGAELSKAGLTSASLRQTRIGGTGFNSADLQDADLFDADLTDFVFEGLTTSTSFDKATLSGARWVDGNMCQTPSIGNCVR